MSYKVEAVTKPITLGEGPHWDVATNCLYFIDIGEGSVHCYNAATKQHHTALIGNGKLPVSFIIPVEGEKNRFIISIKNQVATITWDGKSPKTSEPEIIAAVEENVLNNRINDGKCDAQGRLWTGTMGKPGAPDGLTYQPVGAFYSISKNNNVTKHLDGIKCSNGLAWSHDNKKLYYADSFKYRVDSYDFDIESGTLSNEKTIFDFRSNNIPGIPDGMTIDTEGKLLVANFNGSQVLRIDPETGKLVSSIKIPALQTTSVVFGGPNMDELYVTSANVDPKTDLPAKENGTNGCVFKVTATGLKGSPLVNFKL